MVTVNSQFSYDSDFSKVTADIQRLVREATNANSVFAQLNKTAAAVKTEAARSFSAQAGFAGFKTQIVDLTGATEQFGQQLMKNKLTMREYYREAAQAYKKDSKARALAEREVRRAQSTVVGMGDVNGRRKGMLVTPQALDMSNSNTQLMIASKQYEIFNNLVNQGSTALVNWGKNTQWAGRQLTVGLTVPMGLFAGQAIRAFSELDKQVTRFRKVYGSDLTGTVSDSTDEMVNQIRTLGSEFAKQYGIASAQTMELAADLAAAGFEGQKLATAVTQTTRMMVLGEVDRQEAMKATLSIQTAFNQSSKELAQSIDFLNQVENSTSASLQDLVEAIPKAGPVIQSLGGDVKDLSVLMTAMREGGIAAAEGANALKSGMASLISPTTKAIAVAKQFGIDLEGVVKRNRGELMPMLMDFQEQLSGLDDFGKAKLIEEIFGKYQFARISALFDNLNQQGSQTVGMMKLMDMSADELAKKSYSELKAQERAPSTRLAAMQQQLQEQLIKVGAELAESLLPVMQGALDILSKIVDGFNNLPEPIKNFAKIIGGITAAAGPVLMLAGVFGNLIGNAIKFGMSIVNMFKRMTGHPVQQLQILSDEELAAKLAADQLTGAYERQKTSIMQLNTALDAYIANLREAASVAPPGAVMPGARKGPAPIRRQSGGIIFAQNGVDSGGRINGYGGGDTVPAMLEPGEFVINKKSSQKYKGLLTNINQGKDVPGYQTAGEVGTDGAVAGTSSTDNPLDTKNRMKANRAYLEPESASKTLQSTSAFQSSIASGLGTQYMELSEQAIIDYMERNFKDVLPKDIYEELLRETILQRKSDRSHVAGFKNIIEFEDWFGNTQQTTRKAMALGTMSEPGGYNKALQTLQEYLTRNDSGAIVPAMDRWDSINQHLPNPFNIQEIESISSILGRTGAAVSVEDRRIIDTLFSRIKDGITNGSNPEALIKAVTNSSSNNAGKMLASMIYNDEIMGLIIDSSGNLKRDTYREVLRNQLLSAAQRESVYATYGPEIDAFIERNLDKYMDFGITPEYQDEMARFMEEKTGLKVLTEAERAARTDLTSEKDLLRGAQTEAGGRRFSESAKAFVPVDISTTGRFVTAGMHEGEPVKITLEEQRKLKRNPSLKTRLIRTPRGWIKTSVLQKNGGLIPGYAAGGLVGGLQKIMTLAEARALPKATEFLQKGFTVDRLKGAELSAIRKKQTGLMHDTKMFRGSRYNWDAAEVGQTIVIPGSRSWSTREDVAGMFSSMNRLGGEKRSAQISNQDLLRAGIDPETFGTPGGYGMFRQATNSQEEYSLNRIQRINQIERQRKAFSEIKELEAQKKALMESPYPSQENTLFGLTEPAQFEVVRRQKELQELERKIHSSRVDISAAREMSAIYRKNMKGVNEDPVIFEMVTPQGTQTVPLSDITGRGRSIEGMGQMDEFEHILTDGTMRIVKKYIDDNGVKRIVGEFVGAQKFANGGKLAGYGGGDTVPAMLEPGEFVINKKSTAKYAPLLENINRDSLPGFNEGGVAGRQALMSAGMQASFLPMTLMMIPQMDGLMKSLTILTVAVQALMIAIELNTAAAAAGGWGAVGKKISAGPKALSSGIGSKVENAGLALRTKGMQMGASAGGKGMQLLSKGIGSAGSALMRLAPLAGPIGLAVAGVAAAGAIGFMLWKKRTEELAATSRSFYQEATEMAKVYNIELNTAAKSMDENRKYAEAFGTLSPVAGKGQTDKDYAEAIKKDFGTAIDSIKGLQSEQDKVNRLTSIYASLITQGYSKNQAKEITAEVARQAKATSALATIYPQLDKAINNTEDAMQVLDTTFAYHMSQLTTIEEKVSALAEAYDRVKSASSTAATQSVISTQNLLKTTAENDGGDAIKDLVNSELANAGVDEAGVNEVLQKFAGTTNVDWASEAGQELATTILMGVNSGMTKEDLMKATSLEDLQVDVGVRVSMQDAKIALNQELELLIKELQDGINAVNKEYDAKIDAIEKEKEAIMDAHEDKMKAYEAEAKALQDRADLIRDNTDFYISQLEKEYSTEQYYQKQRENAAGGLKSLAEGDIFGYLQSQMQASSDASQFGREQAIQQIEDTRDAALKKIDAQLEANQAAKQALDEVTQDQLEGKDNQIEALNKARSVMIKDLNNRIKEAQAIIASPDLIPEKLEKFQKDLGTTVGKLAPDLQKPFKTVGENLASTVSTTLNKKASEINSVFVQNADVLKGAIRGALGTVVKQFNPDSGTSEATLVLPGGYEIKITDKKPDDAGDGLGGGGGNNNPQTPPTNVSKSKYKVGQNYRFGQTTYTLKTDGKKYWWQNAASLFDKKPILQYKNSGGKIMRLNQGDMVPGFGNSDTVPAMLTPGEFVVDRTATRRNMPVLQAMNAGTTFSVPQLSGYDGKMGAESETYNNNVNMPVNITINGSNLTIDQIKNDIYGELVKAKKMIVNSIGGDR